MMTTIFRNTADVHMDLAFQLVVQTSYSSASWTDEL